MNIKDLAGFTSDNVPVTISGNLFFRVRDSYDACFSVNDFQRNVANIGTSAIRSVIGHFAVSMKLVRGQDVHTNILLPSTMKSLQTGIKLIKSYMKLLVIASVYVGFLCDFEHVLIICLVEMGSRLYPL